MAGKRVTTTRLVVLPVLDVNLDRFTLSPCQDTNIFR